MADRGQRDKKDAVGEITQVFCRGLDCQAALTDAAWAKQGDQAFLLDQFFDMVQFIFTPHEFLQQLLQVIGRRVEPLSNLLRQGGLDQIAVPYPPGPSWFEDFLLDQAFQSNLNALRIAASLHAQPIDKFWRRFPLQTMAHPDVQAVFCKRLDRNVNAQGRIQVQSCMPTAWCSGIDQSQLREIGAKEGLAPEFECSSIHILDIVDRNQHAGMIFIKQHPFHRRGKHFHTIPGGGQAAHLQSLGERPIQARFQTGLALDFEHQVALQSGSLADFF